MNFHPTTQWRRRWVTSSLLALVCNKQIDMSSKIQELSTSTGTSRTPGGMHKYPLWLQDKWWIWRSDDDDYSLLSLTQITLVMFLITRVPITTFSHLRRLFFQQQKHMEVERTHKWLKMLKSWDKYKNSEKVRIFFCLLHLSGKQTSGVADRW